MPRIPRGTITRRHSALLLGAAVVAVAALVAVVAGSATTGDAPGAAEPVGPPPAPDEPIPRHPRRLAERLTEVSASLDRSIDQWAARGVPAAGSPPEAVTLEALHQQRIYRLLARRPRLAARTFRHLPRSLRPMARDTTIALRNLFRLTSPTNERRFKTQPPLPAGVLLGHYRLAERRFGVARHVLAAVNFVESAFGRLRNESIAGARGPMQFMPATWRMYGMGGNVHDPRDAILGAANYLRRSGAPRHYRRALFAYNHSRLYVDAVLRYARRMARSRRAYLAFYSWQVFVRTRSGDRRITGPGIAGGG